MNSDNLAAELHDTVASCARAEMLRDKFGLLTPSDLAALIGVDTRTLAGWRAQGVGPDVTKLGRGVFYRRIDVEAWIELNVMPTDRTIR